MDIKRKKELLEAYKNRRPEMGVIAFCCGRRLQPLTPAADTEGHELHIEEVEDEYYATVEHEMRREHYLLFAACVSDDRVWFNRLYPEQSPAFRFPNLRSKTNLYLYCTKHGLLKYNLDSVRRG